ncbi:MAG: arsenite methyltransferase [Anaerolineae bacterium]|nr:arsenite methyltransferase [Anaerolineae bacterium]
MTDQRSAIHDAVRDHYAGIARQADPELKLSAASCCGDSSAGCSCSSMVYDPALLQNLPASVTDLSLGCGDPVTIAALRPGETVLDLGSGGGIDCFLAARQVGPQGHVIGVDMTPEMLERAEANRLRLGMANVEFRRGQIEALPVEDASVDVIMSNCVINLSPDKAAVFREAFRVLKPGGRIAISDIVTAGDFGAELQAQLDHWAECVTGAIDVESYTALMRTAGFVEITVVDKADADSIITPTSGMPRIFSARITARKPA